ncbi:MAG: hypothetical protein HRT37_19845 [Alteromonadaceae bacterium]|nr:hypothetical protein [Alteromonadaceae bacterium]
MHNISILRRNRDIVMDIEHGEVSITVHENIIIVELKGAFNEFGAKKYTEGVKL